ncbi:MAG: hypothetical protein C4524_02910, partial [Candidatus Zixiibacteriota bacterium]
MQANSPCINTGDPNWQLDPDGSRADMGAYPYTPPSGSIAGLVSGAPGPVGVHLLGAATFDTQTTVDGSYSFTDVPPGNYQVQVDVPFGYGADLNPKPVTVIAGQESAVDFTLTPIPATISGTISPPLEGVPVELVKGDSTWTDTTDANGQYCFSNLSPGTYQVIIVPPDGYTPDQPYIDVPVEWGQNGTADPGMTPIPGTISGIVSGYGAGLTVTLAGGSQPLTTLTDENGHYAFTGLDQGSYFVDLEVPAGYAVDYNHVPVNLLWGGSPTVNFQLTLLPVTITAQLSPSSYGVTVCVTSETFYQALPTDAQGCCTFADLPGNAAYTVEMVLPLGFVAVGPSEITEYRVGGTTWAVAFQMAPIVTANEARGKGYWKQQVMANLSGQGNPQYTAAELLGFAGDIFAHFHNNATHPIAVEGVTFTGSPAGPLDLEAMQAMLNINQGGSTLYQRACQHYLTLLLNVVSGKVGQYLPASQDGATVSQAIVYIHQLLTSVPANSPSNELAKDIAEVLNQAQTVGAGVIPLSTPNVIFSGENAGIALLDRFDFSPPVPNPFNPTATLRFQLPQAERTVLTVYAVTGSQV